MIVAILLILLITVILFYFTDTIGHLFHSVTVTGRMLLVMLVIFLVLGLLIYSQFKFGIL